MVAERSAGGLGGKLRAARERRGKTLRDIADATKISPAVLDALERNDVLKLPGGVFARAFVRSYAVEVGLDPEDAIREFVAQLPDDVRARTPRKGDPIEDNEAIESERRMASALLRILLVSVPLAGALLYISALISRPSDVPAPAPTPVPGAAAVAGPRGADTSVERGGPSGDSAARSPVVLSVALVASAPCWVDITVDGKVLVQREMRAGDHELVAVYEEAVIRAGNAAALALTLNGAAARPLGGPGQVVTLRLNPTNYKEFLPAP
jgi:transcriptional regulator with XRE-family HTH domain